MTAELAEWAQREGIPHPERYVEEFKDYWRSEGKQKKDWVATFKNRLRFLREHGRLKPRDWKEQFAAGEVSV